MSKSAGKLALAELSRIDREIAGVYARLASLTSARAEVLASIAEDRPIDLGTGRREPSKHAPEIKPVDELTRARAIRELQRSDSRRRVRP